MSELLILGLGNVLCTDDGAGVTAALALAREWTPPEGVEIEDGGTLGLSLLPRVQDARRLILLDAVQADAPPGTLLRMEGDEVESAVAYKLSPHQVGVADLLDSLRFLGGGPERIVLLGVVPQSIGLGIELSPPVAAALPALVRAAIEVARELGFDVERAA